MVLIISQLDIKMQRDNRVFGFGLD